MPKLYELSESYQAVWNLVEAEDVDLDVIEDTLQSIEGVFEEKVESIAKFILQLNSDAEAIKSEEKRLADRRKALENKREYLKRYVMQNMTVTGKEKVKTPVLTVAVQKSPPSVEIKDAGIIPETFLTVIPEQKVPDKAKILDALKAGEVIPGVEMVQGKHLRIR